MFKHPIRDFVVASVIGYVAKRVMARQGWGRGLRSMGRGKASARR